MPNRQGTKKKKKKKCRYSKGNVGEPLRLQIYKIMRFAGHTCRFCLQAFYEAQKNKKQQQFSTSAETFLVQINIANTVSTFIPGAPE